MWKQNPDNIAFVQTDKLKKNMSKLMKILKKWVNRRN